MIVKIKFDSETTRARCERNRPMRTKSGVVLIPLGEIRFPGEVVGVRALPHDDLWLWVSGWSAVSLATGLSSVDGEVDLTLNPQWRGETILCDGCGFASVRPLYVVGAPGRLGDARGVVAWVCATAGCETRLGSAF